jgi:hypothetical protein
MRLRLWTAATKGPVVYPWGNIHGHGEPWSNNIYRGNSRFIGQSSLAVLPNSQIVSKKEEVEKEIINFVLRNTSVILRRVL